jgi:hypothetical protein
MTLIAGKIREGHDDRKERLVVAALHGVTCGVGAGARARDRDAVIGDRRSDILHLLVRIEGNRDRVAGSLDRFRQHRCLRLKCELKSGDCPFKTVMGARAEIVAVAHRENESRRCSYRRSHLK